MLISHITILLLGLFSTTIYCLSVVPFTNDTYRLIELSENVRVWKTVEEVDEMAECGFGQGFFDVTDHPEKPDITNTFKAVFPTELKHEALVRELAAQVNGDEIWATITKLSDYFTRYYTTDTSVQAAQYLKSRYDAYSVGRTDIKSQFFTHAWAEPSIIVTIQGSGAKKDEVVIIGGHIDSIYQGAKGRAPGADDDASGSSTVLEVFRVLVQNNFKPGRTIEFHGYAAEEVGLRGSQDIAKKYFDTKRKVVAQLQLDMVGYPTPTKAIAVITDFTNAALNDLVRNLIDKYSGRTWVNSKCGYGCSDHASFNKYGFASAFPFEAPMGKDNPNIHTPNDLLSKLDKDHAVAYGKLGVAFITELGT